MSVNLNARNFSQPSVFAENAQTVIPVTPSAGVAYRDPNINPAVYSFGQAFDSIVDSRVWNQLLYLCSSFSQEGELFGFFRWSPLTDYVPGSNVTATDGTLYRAVRASGPSLGVGARNPIDYPDYWITLKDWLASSQGPVGGVVPVGHIALLPFRFNALPFGWYFCNGERFTDDVPAGLALKALPQGLRDDWGITTEGTSGTNVPRLLDSSGRGYFLRGVDNVSRMPGTIEQDAARQITATANSNTNISGSGSALGTFNSTINTSPSGGGSVGATGAFTQTQTSSASLQTGDGFFWNDVQTRTTLNASVIASGLSASTITTVNVNTPNAANENRPTNIGMTPCIYLGV